MELFRALAALVEPPGAEHVRIGRVLGLPGEPDPAAFTDLFVLELYPYASVHLGAEGMLGGEARDRVAGFWRAVGRTPPAEPDHLAALLALYAALAEREDAESDAARRLLWRQGRHALLWEHLLSWLVPYLDRTIELAPPFYRAWGELLQHALVAEAEALGPPDGLPLHLREAPPLPGPAEVELEEFLNALLAPVRSGIIVTRSDLARAARELGLGMRVGERRFTLESLLRQAPDSTLRWLGRRLQDGAARHRRAPAPLAIVAGYWAARAEAAATALDALRPAVASAAD